MIMLVSLPFDYGAAMLFVLAYCCLKLRDWILWDSDA